MFPRRELCYKHQKIEANTMMIVHAYALSPFNEKVTRTLQLKGLDYEIREYPLGSQAVKAFNPSGKLPCLEHEGRFIPDSTDIVYYLEEQFPQNPVIPGDSAQQALVHIIEDWADESLYFYEMHMRFGLPENGRRNIPRMLVNNRGFSRWFLAKVLPKGVLSITEKQGVGRKSEAQLITDVTRHCAAVDKLLAEGDWLVGDHLSLADLAVYSMILCLRDAHQAATVLAEFPRIDSWMAAVEQATAAR
jgi:glutathione S-transferase